MVFSFNQTLMQNVTSSIVNAKMPVGIQTEGSVECSPLPCPRWSDSAFAPMSGPRDEGALPPPPPPPVSFPFSLLFTLHFKDPGRFSYETHLQLLLQKVTVFTRLLGTLNHLLFQIEFR